MRNEQIDNEQHCHWHSVDIRFPKSKDCIRLKMFHTKFIALLFTWLLIMTFQLELQLLPGYICSPSGYVDFKCLQNYSWIRRICRYLDYPSMFCAFWIGLYMCCDIIANGYFFITYIFKGRRRLKPAAAA